MDIYAEITDKIISQLEKGVVPWHKPWTGLRSGAISHTTGKPYSLINQLLLEQPGEYITFNQCKSEGGKVRKGVKSKAIFFWKIIVKDDATPDGKPVLDSEGKPSKIALPYLRYYSVFHINDCEDIKAKWKDADLREFEPDEEAERVIADYTSRTGVRIIFEQGDGALYNVEADAIILPLREQFEDAPAYYDTVFHETTHSTGHASRLNRHNDSTRFGSENYSKEELVAEMGAAVALNTLGMETGATLANSASYIQNWLKVLKDDRRLIVSAACRAQKAVNMIFNIQDHSQEQE